MRLLAGQCDAQKAKGVIRKAVGQAQTYERTKVPTGSLKRGRTPGLAGIYPGTVAQRAEPGRVPGRVCVRLESGLLRYFGGFDLGRMMPITKVECTYGKS